MLRVAIVGCGKIADSHVEQIKRIAGATVIAACDQEPLMARQVADRFGISAYYDTIEELLARERPDVVHITTSPQSHLALGKLCLEAGTHVYVEKPFTLTYEEAVELLECAERSGRKVVVGHNVQFTEPAKRMRRLVGEGYLGGPPCHMESHYGYDLGDVSYVKALMGDRDHWVRRLPGRLLHNIISHGIGKIAEFFPGDNPEVITCAFPSPLLRKAGETELVDELRVVIADRDSAVTAYFTFSTQVRPILHQFRVYGPKNGLMTDDDHMVLLRLRGRRYKSYLEQFVPPAAFAKQYLANFTRNVKQFLSRELHSDLGMKNLIEAFYQAIEQGAPSPISRREILLTTKIMDEIFRQVSPRKLPAERTQ